MRQLVAKRRFSFDDCLRSSVVLSRFPPNQSLAAVKSTFDFVKQFSMFATLALAGGGLAPSR